MLYTLKSYLKFLLTSTNEHGVHSPFVFALLTKCIYKKDNIDKKLKTLLTQQHPKEKQGIRSKKKQLILYKIASYFKSSEIFVLGKSKNTKELISLARPNSCVTVAEDFEMQFCEKEFDLVVIDTTNGIYNTVTHFFLVRNSFTKASASLGLFQKFGSKVFSSSLLISISLPAMSKILP